jgi:hypothetical protein
VPPRRALVAGLRVLTMRRRHDPFLARATVADLLAKLGQSPNACRSFLTSRRDLDLQRATRAGTR